MAERARRASGRLIGEVLPQFVENKLEPLPLRTFRIERMVDALRHMARAEHIGKVVIQARRAQRVRRPRTCAPRRRHVSGHRRPGRLGPEGGPLAGRPRRAPPGLAGPVLHRRHESASRNSQSSKRPASKSRSAAATSAIGRRLPPCCAEIGNRAAAVARHLPPGRRAGRRRPPRADSRAVRPRHGRQRCSARGTCTS